jgi:hypothetical protein
LVVTYSYRASESRHTTLQIRLADPVPDLDFDLVFDLELVFDLGFDFDRWVGPEG